MMKLKKKEKLLRKAADTLRAAEFTVTIEHIAEAEGWGGDEMGEAVSHSL